MSAFGGVKVPATHCAYWLDGRPCFTAAPYRVFFADCPSCAEHGRTCVGHGVCDEHAVHARNGSRRSPVDGSRLVVERITSNGPIRNRAALS